ncbi:MAG: type II toxin-antitoxin system RelE/ParE family toxin [Candidatus Bathyarchaeia archaeon]|nr:type II toxin-antitoxin system RelE/ParE family toxin [Candidatus Bathyarchaeota archaeon]
MGFRVFLHPKAVKELSRLDEAVRNRVVEALKRLEVNPEKAGKRLKPSAFWSLRVGDYRAIYEIDKNNSKVIVLFVGYRSKVYEDLTKML